MAQAETPVKPRHTWTKAEKRELVSRLNKAKRGEAQEILDDFAKRTGVNTASIRAYYYSLRPSKADAKPKTPAKAAAPKKARRSSGDPLAKLAQQHASLKANVAAAESSLAKAQKALADFESKVSRLA